MSRRLTLEGRIKLIALFDLLVLLALGWLIVASDLFSWRFLTGISRRGIANPGRSPWF